MRMNVSLCKVALEIYGAKFKIKCWINNKGFNI